MEFCQDNGHQLNIKHLLCLYQSFEGYQNYKTWHVLLVSLLSSLIEKKYHALNYILKLPTCSDVILNIRGIIAETVCE